MTHVVWKYALAPDASDRCIVLPMPSGARPLFVTTQRGDPYLWALVDPSRAYVSRRIHRIMTGQVFEVGTLTYLGSALLYADAIVMHFWLEPE